MRPFGIGGIIALMSLVCGGCATSWPAEVQQALVAAGDNRAQLQGVLRHYRRLGDKQKLRAAEFLIANMEGHGYASTGLCDADGNGIPFDALDYTRYDEARSAIEALE